MGQFGAGGFEAVARERVEQVDNVVLAQARQNVTVETTGWRACNVTLNPTGYGDTTPGAGTGALDDVWFQVPCDDGFGYDYYRVHFYQDPTHPYNGDRSW